MGGRSEGETSDSVCTGGFPNREKQMQEREKIFVRFTNMKVAYDMEDRKELVRTMERMEINQQLRRRIEDVYRETKNRIMIRKRYIGQFWTRR